MSHQTGIKANDSLKKYIAKCKEGKIRVLKVSIEEEQLVPACHKEPKQSWDKDFDKLVPSLVEENLPCYIFYRLDEKSSLGHNWLLISWSPDTAPVRQKMLYASTKATLKTEFGTAQIVDELHGTVPHDVTLEGYQSHKRALAAPAPLSTREEELQEIKRSEVHQIDTKHQNLGAVIGFPLTEDAKQAILDMAKGSYDYLQLKIDLDEEKVVLSSAENLPLEKLPSKVPQDSGRYHIYKFKHTHEGDYQETFVFIYSMPDYDVPIRERMIYSSSKRATTIMIEMLGLELGKKLEIDSGKELTEKFLYDEMHPTKCLHRPKFDKPKGPPNRGPKRMTKPEKTTD